MLPGFSMCTIWSFESIENKHGVYRGKDCYYYESLREHSVGIINFKKKKIMLLANEQQKSCKNAKICYICIEKFDNNSNHHKVGDHCHYTWKYRGASQSICNSRCSVPKEIPIVLHNGSNYEYYFTIKELPEELEKQFACLVESTKKYINVSVPVEKEWHGLARQGVFKTPK